MFFNPQSPRGNQRSVHSDPLALLFYARLPPSVSMNFLWLSTRSETLVPDPLLSKATAKVRQFSNPPNFSEKKFRIVGDPRHRPASRPFPLGGQRYRIFIIQPAKQVKKSSFRLKFATRLHIALIINLLQNEDEFDPPFDASCRSLSGFFQPNPASPLVP